MHWQESLCLLKQKLRYSLESIFGMLYNRCGVLSIHICGAVYWYLGGLYFYIWKNVTYTECSHIAVSVNAITDSYENINGLTWLKAIQYKYLSMCLGYIFIYTHILVIYPTSNVFLYAFHWATYNIHFHSLYINVGYIWLMKTFLCSYFC